MEENYICKFCGKICKNDNSLRNHERLCKENPDHQESNFKKLNDDIQSGKIKHWAKGETKYTNDAIKRASETKSLIVGESSAFYGHKHSDETKQRISNSMKLAHKEGRTSSWIGRWKRSYAEESWFNILTNNNIKFENNYNVSIYWLDFAWPDKKIYFEVDGRTHFTEEGKLHDLKRTQKLNELGWTLIGRCNWLEYQKLSYDKKKEYVDNIIIIIKTY